MQYKVTLPPPVERILHRARKKTRGSLVGEEEPHKEHFVFSDVSLSLWLMRLPSCLFVVFIYDPLLCLYFRLSFYFGRTGGC